MGKKLPPSGTACLDEVPGRRRHLRGSRVDELPRAARVGRPTARRRSCRPAELIERFRSGASASARPPSTTPSPTGRNWELPARPRSSTCTPMPSSPTCASRGATWDEARDPEVAPIVQEKIGRLGEFPEFAGFLFEDVEPDPALLDAGILTEAANAARAARAVDGRDARGRAERRSASGSTRSRRRCTCRSASPITGSRISPGLYESLELLGRDVSLARLRAGAARAALTSRCRCAATAAVVRWRRDDRLRGPDRERARADRLARDHPGAHRCVRRRDRGSPVDPHRPGARRRGAVRDHDRPRLPDARRSASPLDRPRRSRARRVPRWASTTASTRCASRPRSPSGSRVRARVTVPVGRAEVAGGEQGVVARDRGARGRRKASVRRRARGPGSGFDVRRLRRQDRARHRRGEGDRRGDGGALRLRGRQGRRRRLRRGGRARRPRSGSAAAPSVRRHPGGRGRGGGRGGGRFGGGSTSS